MRILYIIDHLRADGTQKAVLELAAGLSKKGYHQAIISLNDSCDDRLVLELQSKVTSVRIVGRWPLAMGVGIVTTWSWVRRQRFDVAVTFLFGSDLLGRPLARAAGIPVVISSLRARNVNYRFWQRWLVRRTMRWVDGVVLNSSAGREFAVTQEGAAGKYVKVIPNCVHVDRYAHPVSHDQLCAEFGLANDACVLGSAGRLEPQKGFDLLLDALAVLRRSDLHLLLFGKGHQHTRLLEKAAALKLRGQVHLVGFRTELPRLLGALDLYVQPSRFEGMPNAVLEAMAAACPIVATHVDGIVELIVDGRHGWLVPAGDSSALAVAIDAALADPLESRRRGAEARLRALSDFGPEATVSAWENLLLNMAEARPKREC